MVFSNINNKQSVTTDPLILNIIEDISSTVFDDNTAWSEEKFTNEWKTYHHYPIENLSSSIFCDISFFFLLCFMRGLSWKLFFNGSILRDDIKSKMLETFRKKVLVSLIINKTGDLFTEAYNKNIIEKKQFVDILKNRLSEIDTFYIIQSSVVEHFKRINGLI